MRDFPSVTFIENTESFDKKKKKRGFQNFNLNLYISLQKVKQEHESSKGTLNILLLRYDFILFFKDFKDLSKTSANQPTKY